MPDVVERPDVPWSRAFHPEPARRIKMNLGDLGKRTANPPSFGAFSNEDGAQDHQRAFKRIKRVIT
jgi:hypothetical protein